MEPKYRFRLYILTALIIAGCGLLLHRLYQFQIINQKQYLSNIPSTHTVTIYEPGIRGEITDRHGEPLAVNTRTYEILLNLDEVHKAYLEAHPKSDQPTTPPQPTDEMESEEARAATENNDDEPGIDEIIDTWLMPLLQKHGLKSDKRFSGAIRSHFITHGGLVPYRYPVDLSYEEFARLAENNFRLPGVSVNVRARRKYPYGTLASHVLGHLAEWKKDNIPEQFKKSRVHYTGEDQGIAGVEKTLNDLLTGKQGKKVIVRNEKFVVKKLEDYQPAQVGARVQLTIDARIQFIIEKTLQKIGRGAAVVMDPATGEILAMASVPNYDPNDFIPSISSDQWKAYTTNRAEPFINRAISQFTPGSTFKLPVALAGAMDGRANFRDTCVGFNTYGSNLRIRCWKVGGHGTLGLVEALQRSCNPYFMDMATNVGSSKLATSFDLLGLGRRSGVRLPNEATGIVPGSISWLRENHGNSLARAGLAQVGIGQADSMATPLQICAITATIANGGRYYQPRIVRRAFLPADGTLPEEVLIENIPLVKANLSEHGLTEKDIQDIRTGMWKAVNQAGGTASRARLADVEVAAKTGTAQTGLPDHLDKNNAWTSAFAPFENPRYAVAVMVRNGRSGGKTAGSLVHYIFRGIFALEAGLEPRLGAMDYFPGNFDAYEDIPLPEGEALPFEIVDVGETGDTLDPELLTPENPVRVRPNHIPEPTFAPEPD